jgi:hypothetical protein
MGDDVEAGETDGETYLYYGWAGDGAIGEAPDDPMDVFLFGDDFEAPQLSNWTPNGQGEELSLDADQTGAGNQSLRLETILSMASGMHRDISLPSDLPLSFSMLLRQESGTTSLGVLRVTEQAYAASGGWLRDDLTIMCEINDDDTMEWVRRDEANAVDADVWASGFPINEWAKIEVVYDPQADTLRGFYNNIESATVGQRYRPSNTSLESLNIESEAQGDAVFYIDDFIVRHHLDPEPSFTLGPLEPL